MHTSRSVSADAQERLIDYLKSLQAISANVDIIIRKDAHTGLVQVRLGRVVAAAWGRLAGNGAFLTLAAMSDIVYEGVESAKAVEGNVTLSVPAAERLVNTLPTFPGGIAVGLEEEKLQQAVHLFHQFRRKEAGALLVEILRTNRFYYPAWLWHSRLMTRTEYIKKALNEAKKWGNCDRETLHEAARIEPLLAHGVVTVKRCIFCWSVVQEKEGSCPNCQGMFHVTGHRAPPPGGNGELEKAIAAYTQELAACPGNPRIAFCLCLAFYSLGNIAKALKFIDDALRVSPREALFQKTKTQLQALADRAVQPPPQPSQRVPPVAASSAIGVAGRTILVVEDSQTSRKVITMLLQRKGYVIQEAKNGAEALARLAEAAPDLVLLDLMLPDMSGYEILARIRQTGKIADIPVVMLTGKSNPADRMKGLHHGSNEYLTKPFDPAKLLAVLDKYLEQPAPPSPAQPAAPVKVAVRTVHSPPKAPTSPAPAAKPAPTPVTPAPAPSVKPAPVAAKPAPVAPIAPAAPVAARPAAAGAGQTGQKSILVVEDSPTSRKVISMVIAKRGYTIHEAATGAVAMRKAQEGIPSLILLDAMLPDMTGYEILHRFKNDERLKNVPVVMLTAKNSPVDRQKGLQGGSSAYITKPFDPEKLLAVIDEYI